MVTYEDLPFQNLPAESCANCGFLMQFKANSNGSDGRDEPVTYSERWRGLDYLDEQIWFGERQKLASIRCWMRREFPGDEARPGLSGDAEAKRLNLEAMHRDRSEGSDAYCPQYFPWNPRQDYEQHWAARRAYLQERDRQRWEASQAELRRAWEREQEAERQTWLAKQETSRRDYEGRFASHWLPLVIAAGAVVVSALVGIVSAFIEAGWLHEPGWFDRWWPF